jgi:hypothetical protein
MGADFPIIPRESAVFSRSCKNISLGVVPCQITAPHYKEAFDFSPLPTRHVLHSIPQFGKGLELKHEENLSLP